MLVFVNSCCPQAFIVSYASVHAPLLRMPSLVAVAHPSGPYQSIRERKMVATGARGARSITETLDWICLSMSEGHTS